MVIKERPIITWLLNPNNKTAISNIVISQVSNPLNHGLLLSYLENLASIREQQPNWGLPELVMPSFEEVMKKSERSFAKVMPSLYEEFSNSEECGIILCKGNITLVYGFGDNELHLWCFTEQNGKSVFNFYSVNKNIDGHIGVGMPPSLLTDEILFKGTYEQRQMAVASVANFISSYIAVKKYVPIETVVVPLGKFTNIEGTPLEYVEKKKVINNSGQEVIVMDSRWFRKIVNDNDIYVRGFWRMQNKKNELGEWYKELIFVDSFVRHGYHRNALIEDGGDETEDIEE
ncbi:MAG: hypothetical protein K2M88_08650 [Muribaculaceae bacterium]|nr:hypothetical protein [Muribaculaceae bacterium]